MSLNREYAGLLMRKAEQDQFVLLKLRTDPAAPDEVIGFHAQQAIEKMLKAVLAFHSVRYRRTHDLAELIGSLRDSGVQCPAGLPDVHRLTPFAVAFRYDEIPSEPEVPFDREWAIGRVTDIKAWAEQVLTT